MRIMECPPDPPASLRSWTRDMLSRIGHRPVEWMDQVFLVEGPSIGRFVEAASNVAKSGDVIEVGPGLGSITMPLSRLAPRLVAVEIDRRLGSLVDTLASACGAGNVLIVVGDGVELLGSAKVKGLVSNTPYSASSRIIAAAARNNSIRGAVLGLQLDVARRILAKPGSSDYGRLTLLANRYFKVNLKAVIPRTHYYPVPNVDGAIIEMHRIRLWSEADHLFERLTSCLFSQRNKLASKVVKACSRELADKEVTLETKSKRVRELTLEEIEEILAEITP